MNFLLIRGLARNQGHWYGFEKNLSTKDNEIILLDLPGNGDFYAMESKETVQENLEFVRAMFNKRKKQTGPWCLIAMSLGGMVALEWQSQYPNDFCKIFVINSSANNVVSPMQRFSIKAAALLPILLCSPKKIQEKAILNLTLAKRKVTTGLVNDAINNKFPKTKKLNVLVQLKCAAKFSLPEILNPQNLIIISGAKDHLVSPMASLKISQFYKIPLFINEEAGHDIPLDDGAWLYKIIKSQLE